MAGAQDCLYISCRTATMGLSETEHVHLAQEVCVPVKSGSGLWEGLCVVVAGFGRWLSSEQGRQRKCMLAAMGPDTLLQHALLDQ